MHINSDPKSKAKADLLYKSPQATQKMSSATQKVSTSKKVLAKHLATAKLTSDEKVYSGI